MFKFFGKLLDSNEREVKKLAPLVEKINSLEAKIKKLKDEEFPAQTAAFKNRLAEGESLDDLLPEAFAVAREAIYRIVGERAYDVQLVAAIVLHQGRIAEQKTGEGKTLSAAITAYLNGLSGKGMHIVTVNDYLARRDTGWYGKALHFLGLSVGCIIHEQAFVLDPKYMVEGQDDERLRHLKPVSRKEAYGAGITYGTNNEFGFDYLRDNMAPSLERMVQRGHRFAIVDEVDSILIDEARTPLIISAPDTEPTQKYFEFANLIKSLSSDTDYTTDEKLKTANLTEHGLRKLEKRLNIENLYEKDFETIHHIENALKARTHYLRDRDYVVKEDQVVIVDEFTGRLMFGRRWSEGLHQAVEAKEGVKVQQESRTLATISFQNYFRMYEKLAGMTGTAATEAEEFEKIYQLEVVIVPTNKPMIRKDNADLVYKTERAKYAAVVAEIEKCHKKGQPVLVGTTSIERNEIIDAFLKKKGVPHNILNAKQHEREAQIIAQAGEKGMVTVATNMAGRGVDIVLGGAVPEVKKGKPFAEWKEKHDKVIKLGGLHVIGTERHESRRIDNQLRGRSGRQGDPGSSRFFVSLEDDIMRLFGGEQVAKIMTALKLPEDQPIEHQMVSRAIQQAQVKVEGFNFDMRKRVVEYDDVMNRQREIIYKKRSQVLTAAEEKKEKNSLKEQILDKMGAEPANLVAMYSPEGFTKPEYEKIVAGFCEILPLDSNSQKRLKASLEKVKRQEKITEFLTKMAEDAYQGREKQVTPEVMRQIERFVYLTTIDRLWMDHLDAMDDLREGIGLRGYGQRDPLVEYKAEAFSAFEGLMGSIEHEVVRRVFRVQVTRQPAPTIPQQTTEGRGEAPPPSSQPATQPIGEPAQGAPVGTRPIGQPAGSRVKPVVPGKKKIGRNDPCWCGSGKKFKKCHYPQQGPA
ncbi:MAG TPA: preprotein translocase subunit SecA [Candidatus Bathyarchaeia archaeon]|nr:preprotein translocase subunit SecA [Candidatus Bathyarchaeia archaeon]